MKDYYRNSLLTVLANNLDLFQIAKNGEIDQFVCHTFNFLPCNKYRWAKAQVKDI